MMSTQWASYEITETNLIEEEVSERDGVRKKRGEKGGERQRHPELSFIFTTWLAE